MQQICVDGIQRMPSHGRERGPARPGVEPRRPHRVVGSRENDLWVGRENGQDAIYEYLQLKSVWINSGAATGNPFVMR